MKLTSKPLAAIIVTILFGGIIISSLMGWWKTETTKEPVKFTEGEFEGEYNPADIRGSYTFGDIERSFNVPADQLARAFGLPLDTDAATFAVKDLETIYADLEFEIGTDSVRVFVAMYTGLPYESTEGTYLPDQAVKILKMHATLTDEQIAYLDAHTAILPDVTLPSEEPVPAEEHTEEETDRIIKGKTTFADVLDWGLPQETIEQILGGAMPSLLLKIKDYCLEQGLDFETIKTALQAEVDKLP
jgi:hypothetical protein